jgi:hypothetical protein
MRHGVEWTAIDLRARDPDHALRAGRSSSSASLADAPQRPFTGPLHCFAGRTVI